MSKLHEIREVYLEDIAKISKSIKKLGESLGEMEKGTRTPAQWRKKRKKKPSK